MPINIDLTTLSGWDGLSSGTHTITIKAKASGYRDSNASAGVSVTKPLITTSLCFTAAQSGSTVAYSVTGTVDTSGIMYSTNDTDWTSWDGTAITLASVGDKIYVKNTNNTLSGPTVSDYFKFVMTGKIEASGNTMSMVNNSNITTACFAYLFYNCSSLLTAPLLPATELANACYYYMFNDCSNLTVAPDLPASVLTTNCYNRMFTNCSALTTAPKILGTSCELQSCSCMFQNCTSLVTVPKLFATSLGYGCYYQMFRGCSKLQVSDTQTADAPYEWKIPQSGTFTNTTTYDQSMMFTSCKGTRSSSTMTGAYGGSHTYYTQNQPV